MRFFGSTLVLGLCALWLSAIGAISGGAAGLTAANYVCGALASTVAVKILFEVSVLLHLRDRRQTELRRTATLLRTSLLPMLRARLILAAIGGGILPLVSLGQLADGSFMAAIVCAALGTLALVVGEALERVTFFSACAAPRMPGGIA
jgi:hypothetical protein